MGDASSCCQDQCSYGGWITDGMLDRLPLNLNKHEAIAFLPCRQIQGDLPVGEVTDYDLATVFLGAEKSEKGIYYPPANNRLNTTCVEGWRLLGILEAAFDESAASELLQVSDRMPMLYTSSISAAPR